MRESIQELLGSYQIRKTKKQKQAFIQWLENHATKHGYEIKKDDYSQDGTNLIVGNPREASLYLTAHYDTPANLFIPIIAGLNPLGFALSQLYLVAIMYFPLLILVWGIGLLNIDPMIIALVQAVMFFGYSLSLLHFVDKVPNKNNANDNTSGVSVLLALLEDLKPGERAEICFVFFDEEEKGLVGSQAFKKNYKVKNTPLINFDCVANGEHLVFVAKKSFRESALGRYFIENKNQYPRLNIVNASTNIYASDQIIFKNSLGVASKKKAPIFGYYFDRIHSHRDTIFDNQNIEDLNVMMKDLLANVSNND
ncbi:MAG: M28 family metallopeptidase [Turicibacter sp.]|nr:M28 family metallopeptidase [Turicibacter sp.]